MTVRSLELRQAWVSARRNPYANTFSRLFEFRLARAGMIILLLFVAVAIFAPWIVPMDPIDIHPRDSLERPGSEYLLGADRLGRDQLSRLIYGARISLTIGGAGVGVAVLAGVAIGAIAGWTGKWIDEALMRVMDSLASLPNIVLALTLVAITGGAVPNIILVVALVQTPSIARVVRSQVLSERERDYVTAVVSIGASPMRVVARHVIPNTMAPVIIQASIGFGAAILLEASLSFLGVGVQAPTPTWGGMLRNAFEVMSLAPFLTFVPGFTIFIVVLSFNFVGDALRDILDPKLRNTR